MMHIILKIILLIDNVCGQLFGYFVLFCSPCASKQYDRLSQSFVMFIFMLKTYLILKITNRYELTH